MSDLGASRRLSLPRVLLAVFIVALAVGGFIHQRLDRTVAEQKKEANAPWFASYVDVTATPQFSFQNMGTGDGGVNAVLSFIVPLKDQPCTPSWGSVYTLDKANSVLSLDTRIGRLKQRGGSVVVSFGGLLNSELAVTCTDKTALLAAYKSVIDRYQIDTIDLDIERDALKDVPSVIRRAEVIAQLQQSQRAQGKSLAVWLTLPVTTSGLSEPGTTVVAKFLEQKVDIAGVNAMTMNYGQTLADNQSMFEGSKSALAQTKRQLGILYEQANIRLNEASLWAKVGATPMVGQNDDAGQIFTIDDAKNLNQFAKENGVGRMSLWSANRDVACGSNYVNIKVVSDSCSGVKQETQEFSTILADGFTGSVSKRAEQVTVSNETTKREEIIDDPAVSPYQIWSKTGAYLQGTKVVWRKNVYQAKWWTQGDMPDNPVLQSWQTPWELIGPVLPGDKPIAQPTLPSGTYPEWRGTAAYNAGQRVLFSGVPYQAKWWTQGDSPAKASADPNGSPWIPLTQDQIEQILQQLDR